MVFCKNIRPVVPRVDQNIVKQKGGCQGTELDLNSEHRSPNLNFQIHATNRFIFFMREYYYLRI